MADNGRDEAEVEAVPLGSRMRWSAGLLAGAFLGGAAVFFGLLLVAGLNLEGMGSGVLIVSGFVAVALMMLAGSVVLSALGMGTSSEALGMPEGSIRALIAMVLILMFAIIGIVVFNGGSPGDMYQSSGLTQTQVDQVRAGGMVVLQQVQESAAPALPGQPSPEPRYSVLARASMTAESHDFGLQLLTTVSTLVVAVAGFYFGSRATDRAIQAAKDFRPPARPTPGVLGTVPAPVPGEPDEDGDEDLDSDGPLPDEEDEQGPPDGQAGPQVGGGPVGGGQLGGGQLGGGQLGGGQVASGEVSGEEGEEGQEGDEDEDGDGPPPAGPAGTGQPGGL